MMLIKAPSSKSSWFLLETATECRVIGKCFVLTMTSAILQLINRHLQNSALFRGIRQDRACDYFIPANLLDP